MFADKRPMLGYVDDEDEPIPVLLVPLHEEEIDETDMVHVDLSFGSTVEPDMPWTKRTIKSPYKALPVDSIIVYSEP